MCCLTQVYNISLSKYLMDVVLYTASVLYLLKKADKQFAWVKYSDNYGNK